MPRTLDDVSGNPPDPAVIEALEAAVRADPGNEALRLHLVDLLLQADRVDDARRYTHPHTHGGSEESAEQGNSPPGLGRSAGSEESAEQGNSPPGLGRSAGSENTDLPDSLEDLLDTWERAPAPDEPEIGDIARPEVRLADVGGLDDVKQRIERSFLGPMRHPELREAFGASLGGGLLLYGPPGCGKTFIARAMAGEMGAAFYNVGLADVLDMWIGSSERNLAGIFDVARQHRPCVVFFDELDALGVKRSQLRNSGAAMRGVVNQLLSELDGVNSDNDGLYILGATNHPWDIDTALLRPGRFDRLVFVPPPDDAARESILGLHLRDRPIESSDVRPIVKRTDGWSGADLKAICDSATERAMERSIERGEVSPITAQDLSAALQDARSSVGPWFDQARNYVLYSNTSGQLDDLAAYMKKKR